MQASAKVANAFAGWMLHKSSKVWQLKAVPRSHNPLNLQPFLFLCAHCQHTQQHLALKMHASQLKTSRHHPPSYALQNLNAAQTLLTITSMLSSKFAKMPNKDPSRATSLQQMMSALSSSGQTAIKLANQEAPQTTLYSAPTLRLWPGNLMWHMIWQRKNVGFVQSCTTVYAAWRIQPQPGSSCHIQLSAPTPS